MTTHHLVMVLWLKLKSWLAPNIHVVLGENIMHRRSNKHVKVFWVATPAFLEVLK